MTPFRIKVCGLTRAADARTAWELGADLLGLIFYPGSPRHVSVAKAKGIIERVGRPDLLVGVFVDDDIHHVIDTMDELGIRAAQLHGREDSAYIRTLQARGYTVIKSFTLRSPNDWATVKRTPADIVLLDNSTTTKAGGTGKSFNWSLVPSGHKCNLGIAGGIGAHNLEAAIAQLRPNLVDVNSSVELSPGRKSIKQLRELFHLANRLRYEKVPSFTS